MPVRKLNVTEFAAMHGVSRMTVLRRIKDGGLPAEKLILRAAAPARGITERSEWLIASNAKLILYEAGRPPKALEIEKAIGKAPPKRKPLKGLARVTSIFDRRR